MHALNIIKHAFLQSVMYTDFFMGGCILKSVYPLILLSTFFRTSNLLDLVTDRCDIK